MFHPVDWRVVPKVVGRTHVEDMFLQLNPKHNSQSQLEQELLEATQILLKGEEQQRAKERQQLENEMERLEKLKQFDAKVDAAAKRAASEARSMYECGTLPRLPFHPVIIGRDSRYNGYFGF
jgi:hypothetical protein